MIAFAEANHRTEALKVAPWYMHRRFVSIAKWNSEFDVHKDFKTKFRFGLSFHEELLS